MRDHLAALSRILAVVNKAALWTVGNRPRSDDLFVGWQVFGRYVLNQSPSWTEPASLLLMSWFILLGSAVGVREGNHLGFEIGLHSAPPMLRRCMLVVTEVLVIGFGVAMAWYGTRSRRRHLVRRHAGAADLSGRSTMFRWSFGRRADRALRPREARPPSACRRGGPVGSPRRSSSRDRGGLTPWNSGSCSASSRCCC